MLAYKIKVNGKHVVTASQDDWSVLSIHISANRNSGERGTDGYVRLSSGGLSKENEKGFCHHFRWSERVLDVGDKVEVEIVDVNQVDSPKKRYRSDREVQESPFTDEEWREMRYKDYLELKKEFESNEST